MILNLNGNAIKTIENIGRINAPNLDCISLLDNNIIEIKEFRKNIFKNLTRIYFCNKFLM